MYNNSLFFSVETHASYKHDKHNLNVEIAQYLHPFRPVIICLTVVVYITYSKGDPYFHDPLR